jgi:hypothetical protein
MAENLQRSKGRPGSYKLDRGGVPVENGPFIGEVMNNHDPARTGRLQVYIAEFGSQDKNDATGWRTVRYLAPFYGSTQHAGTTDGTGGYVGNSNAYGMWFTVPDVGVKVLCFFVNGDPNQGYYVGSIPDPDLMHMVPAVGASENYQTDNDEQSKKFSGAERLPVTEINNQNEEIREDARSFEQQRPVHSVVAATMYQQGVIKDRVRGPVGSSSYRESPSNVFGVSTPGRPIYESGASEYNIETSLKSGGVTKEDLKIIGRRGGHSFIMDDGDLTGNDNLVRIRTSKGHQITLSDDGDCLHIMHANGLSWVELGKEGTIEVYSANSINMRSQGDINFHADQNINMYAGESLALHSKKSTFVESEDTVNISSEKTMNIAAKKKISVKSDGQLVLESVSNTTVKSGGPVAAEGSLVLLNSGGTVPATPVNYALRTKLADVKHTDTGWVSTAGKLDSICSRAPTHEPYENHNTGVSATIELDESSTATTQPSSKVSNKMDSVSTIGVRK